MIRVIGLVTFLLASILAHGQEQRADGTWWDNNLEFHVKADMIKSFGELEICIWDAKRDMCVENVMTTYEIRIYDASNKEIWNSMWTGKDMYMKFKKKLPNAHHLTITALRPFVINKSTTTRIYQDIPMQLKYTVQ